MKSRHDMYINYERSFKKRTKRNKNNFGIIFIIIILAIGLGSAAYFVVTARINTEGNNDIADASDIRTTPIPTLTPTPEPLPAAVEEETEGVAASAGNNLPTKVNGIYVSALAAGSSERMLSLIKLADNTEINAMVIDVKDDHGKISYAMDSAMANEIGATTNIISDIDTLIKTLKEKNIYLIARIVAFKDPYLAEQRQDLAVKNPDGTLFRDNNGEGWVNPYNKQVWDYLVEIAAEAAKTGFDEIQFDYIRFSTGAGIAKAYFGEEAKEKSRADIILEFTKYIYENIKPLGVFVSADVYGTIISSSVDAELVGQNYVQMARYLDYICPMIYPSHFAEGNYGIKYPDLEPYQIVRKVMTASEEKLNQIPQEDHKAVVRPWLQDFTATWITHYREYGAAELRDQINGVETVGCDEWILWNSSCNYSEEGLDQEQ